MAFPCLNQKWTLCSFLQHSALVPWSGEELEMIHQAVRALTDTLDAFRRLREGLKMAGNLLTIFLI